MIGRVLRSGTALVCNDLHTLEMSLSARAPLLDAGFRSVVAYPLLVDRTPVGALMLTSYDVGAVGDLMANVPIPKGPMPKNMRMPRGQNPKMR